MAQRQIALRQRLFAGQCDNCADLLGRECRRCARTRCVGQAFSDRHGFGRAAPASQPVAHGLRPHAELARARANLGSRRGQQNHLSTFRQLPWRAVGADKAGQQLLLRGSHHNRIGRQTRHRGLSESRDERAICHATPTVLLTRPNRTPRDQWTQFPPNCGNLDSRPRYGVRHFQRAALEHFPFTLTISSSGSQCGRIAVAKSGAAGCRRGGAGSGDASPSR